MKPLSQKDWFLLFPLFRMQKRKMTSERYDFHIIKTYNHKQSNKQTHTHPEIKEHEWQAPKRGRPARVSGSVCKHALTLFALNCDYKYYYQNTLMQNVAKTHTHTIHTVVARSMRSARRDKLERQDKLNKQTKNAKLLHRGTQKTEEVDKTKQKVKPKKKNSLLVKS